MTALHVPDVAHDDDALGAALVYAAAGWYVGPVKRASKHPGSVLHDGWQGKTSRDPHVIAAWFAGTDYGVFLHPGRSGAIVFDVDSPDKLHPDIARAVAELSPPSQSTRPDTPLRRHYLFMQPQGRDIGNGTGKLAGGWGDVRGRNGCIIVAPSVHAEGGLYRWHTTGALPDLPPYLADQLPDALDAADAATDGQVTAFLASTTGDVRPELLNIRCVAYSNRCAAGESRHQTMTGHLAGAMREVKAGYFDAQTAADTLEATSSANCAIPAINLLAPLIATANLPSQRSNRSATRSNTGRSGITPKS